jgi:SAM-dependent methyltransferase
MGILDTVHGRLVHGRRVDVLSRHFAEMIPPDAQVVDIGCGDGRIGALVMERRDDVRFSGFDIAARAESHIPVRVFDGHTIPLDDGEADVVMLVDVLHHADDPLGLLSEAVRVSRRGLVLKDVTPLGPLSDLTLRAMDWVGNARHGVPLPYDFWSQSQWQDAVAQLGLEVVELRRRLGLYPPPANLVFEKRMHFIARLTLRQEPRA